MLNANVGQFSSYLVLSLVPYNLYVANKLRKCIYIAFESY